MLKVLERDYKQSFDSAMKEFPYCRLLMQIDDDTDTGYLIALSDSVDTDAEYDEFARKNKDRGRFCITGYYKEDVEDCVDY